ncbi:hypothetical protein BJ741DRAFT_587339, partial [Chytriomyces cf. hyalinus JEL632]
MFFFLFFFFLLQLLRFHFPSIFLHVFISSFSCVFIWVIALVECHLSLLFDHGCCFSSFSFSHCSTFVIVCSP